METPIQKALSFCDDKMNQLEIMSRTNYEDAQTKIEMVGEIVNKLKDLISDEKEMINQIYSNCEKIKAQ
jgi:hypothetical protein